MWFWTSGLFYWMIILKLRCLLCYMNIFWGASVVIMRILTDSDDWLIWMFTLLSMKILRMNKEIILFLASFNLKFSVFLTSFLVAAECMVLVWWKVAGLGAFTSCKWLQWVWHQHLVWENPVVILLVLISYLRRWMTWKLGTTRYICHWLTFSPYSFLSLLII